MNNLNTILITLLIAILLFGAWQTWKSDKISLELIIQLQKNTETKQRMNDNIIKLNELLRIQAKQ
jgi:hypothetical protein